MFLSPFSFSLVTINNWVDAWILDLLEAPVSSPATCLLQLPVINRCAGGAHSALPWGLYSICGCNESWEMQPYCHICEGQNQNSGLKVSKGCSELQRRVLVLGDFKPNWSFFNITSLEWFDLKAKNVSLSGFTLTFAHTVLLQRLSYIGLAASGQCKEHR